MGRKQTTDVDWQAHLKPEERDWLAAFKERAEALREDRANYKKIRDRCITRALRAGGQMAAR